MDITTIANIVGYILIAVAAIAVVGIVSTSGLEQHYLIVGAVSAFISSISLLLLAQITTFLESINLKLDWLLPERFFRVYTNVPNPESFVAEGEEEEEGSDLEK